MTKQIWLDRVQKLLSKNIMEGEGFRYTKPASPPPPEYEEQALWDSCFHAIIWRWIDPQMARDELLTVTAHQLAGGADAGMIPHFSYWKGSAQTLWNNPHTSRITQPPLIAVAAWRVYEISKDKNLLELLYPRLIAFHDWFDRRRDPDKDHLVSLIHPWESGWDASPRWDRAMGLRRPTHEEAKQARFRLAQTVVQYDGDALKLAQDGFFHVESIDFNAIRAADLEAVAQIAAALGKDADPWKKRAADVQTAVRAKMIETGIHDLEGLDEKPIEVESASDYVALFGGCVSESDAARLVQRLQEPRNWTQFPVCTNPTTLEAFDPGRYWRGNVWMSVNWLIYQGLRRYGYTRLASQLAERSLALVEQTGFWEYYHPQTGAGLGSTPYSWSALVVDMLE